MTDNTEAERKPFWQQYGKIVFLWGGIVAGILVLLAFGVPKEIIAILTFVLGLFTRAFAGLGAVVTLIPVVGPLIVKVLALPFFWLVNGLGYIVSVIAIKKGYTTRRWFAPAF